MGEAMICTSKQQAKLLRAAQPLVRTAQAMGLIEQVCTMVVNVFDGEPSRIVTELTVASSKTKTEHGSTLMEELKTGGRDGEG
jgi:predicted transposase YdaD